MIPRRRGGEKQAFSKLEKHPHFPVDPFQVTSLVHSPPSQMNQSFLTLQKLRSRFPPALRGCERWYSRGENRHPAPSTLQAGGSPSPWQKAWLIHPTKAEETAMLSQRVCELPARGHCRSRAVLCVTPAAQGRGCVSGWDPYLPIQPSLCPAGRGALPAGRSSEQVPPQLQLPRSL